MGIFPPENADSIALLSNVHLNGPQISGRELAAMSLAQIWAGNSKLPPREEMDVWVSQHQEWLRGKLEEVPQRFKGEMKSLEWHTFIHKMAGTEVYDHVGWSWKAWKLWWNDPVLYKAMVYGVATAHSNRLFETGKRSAWSGARQAILDVDAEVTQMKEAAKKVKGS